jgi:hypothetical protein
MANLEGDTSCVIHPHRRAMARCPSCSLFYCSECITEHEGKLICASCLDLRSVVPSGKEGALTRFRRHLRFPLAAVLQLIAAAVLCWLVFFLFGQTLADIPDEFHDGTIWE